jgi:serine/threonine protein kinase
VCLTRQPENILLCGAGGVAKLTDFGVARPTDTLGLTTQAGTLFYFSPEKLTGQSYSLPDDIWALGRART